MSILGFIGLVLLLILIFLVTLVLIPLQGFNIAEYYDRKFEKAWEKDMKRKYKRHR